VPHAVIVGAVDVERVHRELVPFSERRGGCILRVTDSYLARAGNRTLLDAVVVEGTTRHFLVEVAGRSDGVTLRLFPLTDPDKTDGVRALMTVLAVRIRALVPGARITHTDLGPVVEST